MKQPYHFKRTRVKICGFTRAEDALNAALLGVDALGLVFYPQSSRFVSAEQAYEIIKVLPPFTTSVGLFVDANADQVQQVLNQVPLDMLQFHGDEDAEYCKSFGRPYIKAIRMQDGIDLQRVAESFDSAQGILLDAFHPDGKGGTGHRFDWQRVPNDLPLPVILAGGLRPENVAEGLSAIRPYAVDVSSGVESAKGIKDRQLMADFLDEVKDFDNTN